MRRVSLCALFALLFSGLACNTPAPPFELVFTVFPTAEGADVLVEVHGGPPDEAWLGFSVGPGADPALADRAHSVEARSSDGAALQLVPRGEAGFQVLGLDGDWTLSYSLDLRTDTDNEIFYRGSTRGHDYLVLVGSDAWARFYETSQPLSYAPANRPAGYVGGATVHFNVPEFPVPWRVATTAVSVTPRSFALAEHPVNSVFALGPYDIVAAPGADGLVLAMHRDWSVIRDQVPTMAGDLLAALRERLTEPDPVSALALLNPLPDSMPPTASLRTAGMVRAETMILYADADPGTTPAPVAGRKTTRLEQAMAVFLGHELFHLYVPSAVAVTRDLSWLSEGWAMQMGRLAARDSGWLSEEDDDKRFEAAYRSYQKIGGYRAGSLPDASMGTDSQRDLLYLRGELVFRLLCHEWMKKGAPGTFEAALWEALIKARSGDAPLDNRQVREILATLVDPSIVRRYVEGRAPLTPAVLGLRRR